MKIGLFGGTFNPIHLGHLRGAEEVRENFSLDKIIFIPSGVPPLKTEGVIEGIHRLRMVEAAVKGNPFFEVSDYEIQIKGPSFTLNTLFFFKKLYEQHTLFFIMGVDSFMELHKWHRPEEILKMIDLIVMSRPGYKKIRQGKFIEGSDGENCFRIKNSDKKVYYLPISPFAFSSTKLRELVKSGKSIRYLVPEVVFEYIKEKKLYC